MPRRKSDHLADTKDQNPLGVPLWESRRVRALSGIHEHGGEIETMEALERLGISEKKFQEVVTSRTQILRDEVQRLLKGVGGEEDLQSIQEERIREIRLLLEGEGALTLSQLSAARGDLYGELRAQKKDPEKLLNRGPTPRNADENAENQTLQMDIEVAFVLRELRGRHRKEVEQLLAAQVPENSDQEVVRGAQEKVRADLIALLPRKRREQFDPLEEMEGLIASMAQAEEANRYEKLSSDVMKLFGRGSEGSPFLTREQVSHVLKKDKGLVEWLLGKMLEERRIGSFEDGRGQVIYMCRDKGVVEYTSEELIDCLAPKYFDAVGRFLRKSVDAGQKVTEEYLEEHDEDVGIPSDVTMQLLDCFVAQSDLVRNSRQDGYYFTEKGSGVTPSSFLFERAKIAREYYLPTEGPYVVEGRDSRDVYREMRHVKELQHSTGEKPSGKILSLSEIQFGHRECDEEALATFQRKIEELL